MPSTQRLFVAVTLSEPVLAAIETATITARQAEANTGGDAIRWLPRRNWHVALAFIGHIDPAAVADALEALSEAAAAAAPLAATLSGAGAFPGLRRPRLLWVGVESDGALEELARRTRRALRRHGLAKDESRPFQAHISVARLRHPCDAGEVVALLGEVEPVAFRIGAIDLYESELSNEGSHYRLISGHDLTAPGGPAGEVNA